MLKIFIDYQSYIIGSLSLLAVIKLLKSYFSGGVCVSKARLEGKTVIITGANTGIGKETALDLAKRGGRIILACRDVKKGHQAADEIRKESGNGNVIVEYLDLGSLESVRKFALKMIQQEENINVLINNAGLNCGKKLTADGYDMIFGVNHLGHFLLTNLLLDKLKASAPSRIVNVSSRACENAKMNWDDLMYDKNYSIMKVYGQSKLANVLFTRELAKRLSGTGVSTYALHPGVSITEIGRYLIEDYPWLKIVNILIKPIVWLALKTPTQAAQTSIHCAVSETVSNQTGLYYSDCKVKILKENATNDDDAEKLWKISEELTKKYFQ